MKTSRFFRPQPQGFFRSARARRFGAALAALALLPLAAGCFGTFPLTKSAYRFNKRGSDNEFVQSVLFWFLTPFYVIATVTDILVLNVIEFWYQAPIRLDDASAPGPPIKTAHRVSPSGDHIEIDYTFQDGREFALALDRRAPDRYAMIDARSGRALGEVCRADNGDLLLYNAEGALTRRLPATALSGAL